MMAPEATALRVILQVDELATAHALADVAEARGKITEPVDYQQDRATLVDAAARLVAAIEAADAEAIVLAPAPGDCLIPGCPCGSPEDHEPVAELGGES